MFIGAIVPLCVLYGPANLQLRDHSWDRWTDDDHAHPTGHKKCTTSVWWWWNICTVGQYVSCFQNIHFQNTILESQDYRLFMQIVTNLQHCLNNVLPPVISCVFGTRGHGHPYEQQHRRSLKVIRQDQDAIGEIEAPKASRGRVWQIDKGCSPPHPTRGFGEHCKLP